MVLLKHLYLVYLHWSISHPFGPNDLQREPTQENTAIYVKAKSHSEAGEEAIRRASKDYGIAMEKIQVVETRAQ